MANAGGYAYISPEVNLQVTSVRPGFVLNKAVAVFYKTLNGIWRMSFNIEQTLNATTTCDFTIVNIIAASTTTLGQAVAVDYNSATAIGGARINTGGSGTILSRPSTNVTNACYSGDIELASKPTAYLPDGV